MMICAPQEQVYGAEGWMIRSESQKQEPTSETPLWVPLLLILVMAAALSSGKGEDQ